MKTLMSNSYDVRLITNRENQNWQMIKTHKKSTAEVTAVVSTF